SGVRASWIVGTGAVDVTLIDCSLARRPSSSVAARMATPTAAKDERATIADVAADQSCGRNSEVAWTKLATQSSGDTPLTATMAPPTIQPTIWPGIASTTWCRNHLLKSAPPSTHSREVH